MRPHVLHEEQKERWIRAADAKEEHKTRWIRTAVAKVIDKLNHRTTTTLSDIIGVTADTFGISVSDVTGQSRFWIDVAARNVAMALACRFTTLSIGEITKQCGRHYHAHVIRACNQYDDMIDELSGAIGITAPPRRNLQPELPPRERAMQALNMTPEDLRVLRMLNAWSIDGAFSCVEDILPNMPPQSSTGKLRRLRQLGLAEIEKSEDADRETWWRISQAGRNFLLNTVKAAA